MRSVMSTLAALGMVIVLSACGDSSEHTEVPPLGSSTSTSPTVDAAEATKAVLTDYVKALDRAVKTRSAEPLMPYATKDWATELIGQYQANLWSKKHTLLGHNTVASTAPAVVTGETATIETCLDSSNVFEVPDGTTAITAGSGARAIGRWHDTVTLTLESGQWKVSDISSDGKPC